MYNTDNYIDLIKSRLSEHRFIHSMNVAESARALAKKYGADEEKAYTAGLLHDIMKEESLDVQRKYIEKNGYKMTAIEISSSSVYHQMSGAEYCKSELQIEDNDIINAIRYHTTGRSKMSLLEQIVFTADFISADRKYPDVDIMREKAEISLEEAMLYSLRFTIKFLADRKSVIHPSTIECYNWIVQNK